MMPVQGTSRPQGVDSGDTDAMVVPFPRFGEPLKGLRALRAERGWSQAAAVRAMATCATDEEKKGLPGPDTLLRNWKRWESGACVPDGNRSEAFFRPIIARMFGVPQDNLFPPMSPRTPSTGVSTMRIELQARRGQVRQEISKLQAELAYLDKVLAVPVPAMSQ